MFSKFFTFVFLCQAASSFGQGLFLKNKTKGSEKQVFMNREIDFELFSDSILSVEFLDNGKLISYADSSIILEGDREVLFSDIKSISLYPKKNIKARAVAAPFLFAGLGFLGKGIFMLSFEGLKSKNKQTVPLYLGVGTLVSGIASIPFWGRKKKYKASLWGFVLK